VGVIFVPIGIVVVLASNSVTEVVARYDNLGTGNTVFNVTIPEDMDSPVYVYYELTKFYQNQRLYLKSRSIEQLGGTLDDTGECTPTGVNANGKIIVPCGLVAQNRFTGTIVLWYFFVCVRV
jgi:cell cycle control protein 50